MIFWTRSKESFRVLYCNFGINPKKWAKVASVLHCANLWLRLIWFWERKDDFVIDCLQSIHSTWHLTCSLYALHTQHCETKETDIRAWTIIKMWERRRLNWNFQFIFRTLHKTSSHRKEISRLSSILRRRSLGLFCLGLPSDLFIRSDVGSPGLCHTH